MNLGETIAKSQENWERKKSDYYPTPHLATQALMEWMRQQGYPKMRIREPCCGEGHMSEVLKLYGHEVTSSDLRHTGYGTGGVDYRRTAEVDPDVYDFECVITNPPFKGSQSIIRRALRDAPVVAMLLSNNYWHADGRRALFTTRRPKAVLALTWRLAFLKEERGDNPIANMIWTVWDDDHVGDTAYDLLYRPEFAVTEDLEVTSMVRLGRTGLLGKLEAAFKELAGG